MADEPTTQDSPEGAAPESGPHSRGGRLEGGVYEIIRSRLDAQGVSLRERLGNLNAERQKVFGAVEPSLIATERIATTNKCTARDMVAIGTNRFIFGFNVHIGLKSTTGVADVFGVFEYHPEDHTFHDAGLDCLMTGSFEEEFGYLYKYYKETRFVKFMVIGPNLYMAFRVGKGIEDIKTFKWLLSGEKLEYVGTRFDHEYRFPPQQEFAWVRAHRGMYREGMHPHVSIEDRLFVETVGGDLTVKIEDNTDSGEGIYAEDVTNSDQTLDDAEILYAVVGSLILVRVLPYQEKHYRHLVYNEKVKQVRRIDSIANSCVLLPDDHGIIFSNGYHLQTGETKIFDNHLTNMLFERRIASPNGEDYLYVFYNRLTGVYILMSYNVIDHRVDTPIICNGYSIFPSGELIYFKDEDREPQKHHVLQVWRTPYMEGDFRIAEATDSYLFKLGNADIVRCMAECHEVLNLLKKDDSYADLYVDLAKKSGDVADSYFWVDRPEVFNLKETLLQIKRASESAIAEFDKVVRLRRSTAEEMQRVATTAKKLATAARNTRPDDIMGFVHRLTELRTVRGEVISLKDLRYINLEAVAALETELEEAGARVSENCVAFLLEPKALDPYREQVVAQQARVGKLHKVTSAEEVEAELAASGRELEMLIDIVGNLKIHDSTQTTQIIDDISTIYSTLNRVRADLKNRKKELAQAEGVAQFGAELKLLNQAVINYLDLCDSPAKCEEYLSKMMVQLEELEGRFSDFDEYIDQLTEKRDELFNAFESKKLGLVEARNRRAGACVKSADRILNSIRHRVDSFETINEINGYLASDLMIEKVRDIIVQLGDLGDSVKADDIQTKLKAIREDAVRQLKDRKELFVDGKDIIQFGNHRFSVNRQELELSIVPHDDHMCLHLTGTNFFESVADERFLATEEVWDQEVVSENREVYRAEYLAWQVLQAFENGDAPEGMSVESFLEAKSEERLGYVQRLMAPRYSEGYTKGVHDHDCAQILDPLLRMHAGMGLLRFPPEERALGLVAWEAWEEAGKERLAKKLRAYGILQESLGGSEAQASYIGELRIGISAFQEGHGLACPILREADTAQAAEYLFYELVDDSSFTVSPEAARLAKAFRHALTMKRIEKRFQAALDDLGNDAVARYEVVRDWVGGVCASADPGFDGGEEQSPLRLRYVPEAAAHLVRGAVELTAVQPVPARAQVDGVAGSHGTIESGVYTLEYLGFVQKMRKFVAETVPEFVSYTRLKTQLVEEAREAMRLEEFKARVMTSFVRNRLLDRVYLPLVGDNLAKQIGVVGDDTRTDRMGLLLLVSPPGYGKTTLMEYIANRLGITFMKINGPAIGHDVKSLDPEDAPNASAREEIRKLNFSLEMGDNVMIYIDDIQHCNPEFLQKFIPLCDAQRKIEGVYRGMPKTYDLRGRKVCVVMAGNPYTESGGKFQVPDMLANRADTYNLGDIIGGHVADFEASYLENSLTSNPVLGKLASRSQADVYAVMKIAGTGSQVGIDFEGNYSIEEVEELVSVMKKLMRVRDTVLRVNQEYIRSAAMEDAYRTEPPFRLQGSYRNMNRMAEKILPIMTDDEVEAVIVDHYKNEAQTLTNMAEANLLKFREMEEILTEEEAARWDEIKRKFTRNLIMGGRGDDDPVSRVVGTLATFTDGLDRIQEVLTRAVAHQASPATLADATVEKLEGIIKGLRAVPVDVQIKVVPVQEGPVAARSPFSSAEKKSKTGKSKTADENPGLPVDIEAEVDQGE